MTFYYIVAESYGDFQDYLNVYEIPESEAKHVSSDFDIGVTSQKPSDQHHIHITKFARDNNDMRIKFIDLQIALSQKSSNVKTFIETADGIVTSNVSFLKF